MRDPPHHVDDRVAQGGDVLVGIRPPHRLDRRRDGRPDPAVVGAQLVDAVGQAGRVVADLRQQAVLALGGDDDGPPRAGISRSAKGSPRRSARRGATTLPAAP